MNRYDHDLWPTHSAPSGGRKPLRAVVIALVAAAAGAVGAAGVMSELMKSEPVVTALPAAVPAPAIPAVAALEPAPAAAPKAEIAAQAAPDVKPEATVEIAPEPAPEPTTGITPETAALIAGPQATPQAETVSVVMPADEDLTFAKGYARRRAAVAGDKDGAPAAALGAVAAAAAGTVAAVSAVATPARRPGKSGSAQNTQKRPSKQVGEVIDLPNGRRVTMPPRFPQQQAQSETRWSLSNLFRRW